MHYLSLVCNSNSTTVSHCLSLSHSSSSPPHFFSHIRYYQLPAFTYQSNAFTKRKKNTGSALEDKKRNKFRIVTWPNWKLKFCSQVRSKCFSNTPVSGVKCTGVTPSGSLEDCINSNQVPMDTLLSR